MYIYTHLVLASMIERALKPADPAEYYLGAIIPDARYLAGMPRSVTHLPMPEIAAWLKRYPQLRSFVLGYLVHCAIDEIEVRRIAFTRLPLKPFNHAIRTKFAHALIETHYLENAVLMISLAGASNEITAALNLPPSKVAEMAGWVNGFLRAPSFQAEVALLEAPLLRGGNPRIRRYLDTLLALERSWLVKHFLLRGFDAPGFEQIMVRQLLSDEGVCAFV